MEIKQYSKQTAYNLTRAVGRHVLYIVIHYTSSMASALNNIKYFSGQNCGASADFFIDDNDIWQFNPDLKNYYSWHCGDGHGAYGITNSNSIGVEVVSDGRDFSAAEIKKLAWLVRKLMNDYGVPKERVVRHYDASRKQCPAPYINLDKWNALRDKLFAEAEPPQKPGEPKNNNGIWYRVHVQDYGWLDPVRDGQTAGTTGKSKQVEALKITPPAGVVLDVNVHIQGIGWKYYPGIEAGKNDPTIGSVGLGKRIEAVEVIASTGENVHVQAHLSGTGWTGAVTGGATGSTGLSKAIEALRIWIE